MPRIIDSYVVTILLLVAIGFYSAEGFSMSILTGEKVCVFSGFKGRLTLHGKPAAGARIVRKVSWKDEKGESDETIANENGEFSFSSRWGTLRQLLPTQFVASQEIHVYYNNKEFLIWTMGKLAKGEDEELGGKPVNFRCELADELIRVEVDVGLLGTSCKWDSIKKMGE